MSPDSLWEWSRRKQILNPYYILRQRPNTLNGFVDFLSVLKRSSDKTPQFRLSPET